MPKSLTTHIDSPKGVGKRLKTAREKVGLSQRKLSFPGCTAAYISRLEAGARVPSLQMIQQLAIRLHVTSEWLATGVILIPEAGIPMTPEELLNHLAFKDVSAQEREFLLDSLGVLRKFQQS